MAIFICSWQGHLSWLGLMQRMKYGFVFSTDSISLMSWPRNFSPTVLTLPAVRSS